MLQKHLNIVKCENHDQMQALNRLSNPPIPTVVAVVILSVLANSGSPQNRFPGDE